MIHASVDGFVDSVVSSGSQVDTTGPALVMTSNPEIDSDHSSQLAQARVLRIQRRLALKENDFATAQSLGQKLAASERKARHLADRRKLLAVQAPFAGVWISPEADRMVGTYVHRGDSLGTVAYLDDLRIRAVAKQEMAAQVYSEARERVEIRVAGRSHACLAGNIEQILPAGNEHLPSAALGISGGGAIQVDNTDPQGTKSREAVFEIRIRPEPDVGMLPGQRVVIRFRMRDKPLSVQLWQALSRLIQQRIHTDDEPSTKPNMANALASLQK